MSLSTLPNYILSEISSNLSQTDVTRLSSTNARLRRDFPRFYNPPYLILVYDNEIDVPFETLSSPIFFNFFRRLIKSRHKVRLVTRFVPNSCSRSRTESSETDIHLFTRRIFPVCDRIEVLEVVGFPTANEMRLIFDIPPKLKHLDLMNLAVDNNIQFFKQAIRCLSGYAHLDALLGINLCSERLNNCPGPTLTFFRSCSFVKTLQLTEFPGYGVLSSIFTYLRFLSYLKISCYGFKAGELPRWKLKQKSLCPLESLRVLRLPGMQTAILILEMVLPACPEIRYLDIRHSDFSQNDIDFLKTTCPKLEQVNLSRSFAHRKATELN